MDPLVQSDTYAFAFDIIGNKLLTLAHIGFWNIWSPTGPLIFMGCKRGLTKVERGKGCHWSIWGQRPKDDGQGSCCQDDQQTPDQPH